MNAQRRKQLAEAVALIEKARDIIEEVKDEEGESFENLPEGLQTDERQEKVDWLCELYDELENLTLEEP